MDLESIAFSPNNSRIVSPSCGGVVAWDFLSGEETIRSLAGPGDRATSVVLSPDSTLAALASGDFNILVADVQLGTLFYGSLQGHTSQVDLPAFSHNGTRLSTSSHDRAVRI